MLFISISSFHVSVSHKPILKGLTLGVPAGEAKQPVAVSLEGGLG